MAEPMQEFEKAPKENLRTWDMVWKLLVGSGAAALIFLLLLALIVF